MKVVLFCHLPYCFSILKPVAESCTARGWEYLWYLDPDADKDFPWEDTDPVTRDLSQVIEFSPNAIFVPGNDVPHYLPGVKVQVFHGFAGEKKTHFKIRDYFDLYLTQGPYFTEKFEAFARQYKNFEVVETGWSGVDQLFSPDPKVAQVLKQKYRLQATTILYAPTASANLTSVELTKNCWAEVAEKTSASVLVKFHPLISQTMQDEYKQLYQDHPHIHIVDESTIGHLYAVSDLLVSDTSGVVYEFLLLEKPVVTINSISPSICWPNLSTTDDLVATCIELLQQKQFPNPVASQYHPYKDGKSSDRMLDAVADYIERNGVPASRRVNFFRRRKMNRKYGKLASHQSN